MIRFSKHWLRAIQSLFILTLAPISLSTAFAQDASKGGIDWIVVVDTSASMRGAGGTKNIFNQVKKSITEFVNTARLGDTVTIYSFDKDVTLQTKNSPIANNLDRGELKQIITSLEANGLRTHTGKAVQEALQHSAVLNQRSDALGRTVSIVFLTDGVEDVSGIPNPVPIPSNTQFLREQQCKPYIFFVSLGQKEHEKQLNDFANNPALCGKGRVLRDPGGVELNRLAQNIRPVVIKPKIDISIPDLKLQPVSPGTAEFKINGISNINNTVSLQLQDPNKTGIRLSPNSRIVLAANKLTSIPVGLQIPDDVQGGVSGLRLVLASENKAIAPITVDLPVTIKAKLLLQPTLIDLGSVEVGETTATQIVVRSNISGNAKLQLQGNSQGISLVQPDSPVSLQIGETKIPVQLQVADNSSEGDRTFTLQLVPDAIASPIAASIQLNILIPLWRKIITWSLLILLLLLIALIVICFIQRQTPLELLQDIRTRKHLEGALLILEPPPQSSVDEEISLANLHKTKVYLSDLIPAIDAANSDAELVTVRQSGKKNIELRCRKGNICINDKEVTTDEIYDEDIIEIGNVKLQFNWIEHQRIN
ncbi:vWA domain-containing protein [Rivularia sp. UHCC 0363]|uniref:vWA domain-containing protein n=1 Tax=Rivularia sp. UHCC 0363 TaxID=3110244 RepID=UPI002B1ED203|nr:vWA domain-containing protein [Rivularia sp. UHCC 0363]MEA5596472.1 vWA domain-containing protein [Rivularia sp. UHCC 0363]